MGNTSMFDGGFDSNLSKTLLRQSYSCRMENVSSNSGERCVLSTMIWVKVSGTLRHPWPIPTRACRRILDICLLIGLYSPCVIFIFSVTSLVQSSQQQYFWFHRNGVCNRYMALKEGYCSAVQGVINTTSIAGIHTSSSQVPYRWLATGHG